MNWIIAAAAGIASGILGAMGMGGGGILIIYLTLMANVPQATAQGINLIFFIPSALIALIIYCRKKLIIWKVAIPAAALGVLGGILGATLSSVMQSDLLAKLFGALLLVMGIKQVFGRAKPSTLSHPENAP